MSRMRVLQVNLHLTSDGCLVAVQEVGWKGHHRNLQLLQRFHLESVDIDSNPRSILQAVALAFDLGEPRES